MIVIEAADVAMAMEDKLVVVEIQIGGVVYCAITVANLGILNNTVGCLEVVPKDKSLPKKETLLMGLTPFPEWTTLLFADHV